MAARIGHFLWDRRSLPFALALGLGLVAVVWNAIAGLRWDGPSLWTILLFSSPLVILAVYTALRGMGSFCEAIVFGCMYLVVPMLAVRLSYLVTTLNFPLVDHGLERFDLALGFDWAAWANVINTHPVLHMFSFTAYMSPIGQALISTAIFAFARPARRNAEILFTLVFALGVVISIYAVFPELGPGSIIGRHYEFESNIMAIRAGDRGPFPYTGIVSFPSFHTVMAIVFTYGHRGLRASFWPVAMLNAFMLLGTPTFGDHYLADMCAGAVVAAGAILLSRAIYGEARDTVRYAFPVPQGAPVLAD